LWAGRTTRQRPKTGLLGADYKVENGRYRIAKILGGQNWTPGLASPLTLPGVYVHEGATCWP
jgi:tricorn protease